MGLFFKDDLQDALTWAAGYIPYGGADFGEILAVARAVGDGDNGVFNKAWVAAGDRLVERAEIALAAGKRKTARDAFLRASCHYASSYRPLFGTPADPRLLAAFRKQINAFNEGLRLSDAPVAPLGIPFDGHSLPAYFLPAQGRAAEVRPLMILTNGYDATVTDMYFASAVAASQRGYHCLFFDGPGQGAMLYEQGEHMRPDWENVVTPVVDFALQIKEVDPQRIALMGWSFGGYLAPRAASGEQRLAACIADPGLLGGADQLRQALLKQGASPAAVADLGHLDDAIVRGFEDMLKKDRHANWSIVQRAFWVHGVESVPEYFRCLQPYTLAGRIESIQCPTLVTFADSDPLASTAQTVFEQLRCPKTLMTFAAAEGAGMHVEAFNRSLLNTRVYEWLDEIFA
jgi:alpha-beta hydrolase superfamily lysophospholipase